MIAGIEEIQKEIYKTGVVKIFLQPLLAGIGGESEIDKRDPAVIDHPQKLDPAGTCVPQFGHA